MKCDHLLLKSNKIEQISILYFYFSLFVFLLQCKKKIIPLYFGKIITK